MNLLLQLYKKKWVVTTKASTDDIVKLMPQLSVKSQKILVIFNLEKMTIINRIYNENKSYYMLGQLYDQRRALHGHIFYILPCPK